MKFRHWIFALTLLGGAPTASPQAGELSIDEAVRIGQQFAEENLDPEVLSSLNNLDQDVVRSFLIQLQEKLNSEYVIDLSELRQTANVVLPLLEAHEDTAPYGAWLRTRLDYLEAAEQLRRQVAPPKPQPGKPLPPPQKPGLALERKVWVALIDKRPLPPRRTALRDKIEAVFAANGLPEQLVWLAEEESGFNAKARSPAGAAGLFQLMPATARTLGLSTHWPDERLDPDKSAPAAAKYLKYLHGRFKDWKLALAAYNVGEGRLAELMKRHKAQTFEAVSPWLPAETQMYVPKFEAILQKREGLTLAQLTVPKSVSQR